MIKEVRIFLLASLCCITTGCGSYSFTGAALSPEIETVSIQSFPNRSDVVNPQLSDVFKRSLEDKFLSGTSLELVDSDGDIAFEGVITRYSVDPIAARERDRASTNRFTITVNVRFTNKHDEEQNFEQRFSSYEEFDANTSFSTVEETLMREVCRELAEDIFNRTVIDW